MGDLAIAARSLSKQYRIGGAQSQGWGFGKNVFSAGLGRADTIWAVDDVSFEVRQGEVLGVIGRNGSGKSTLLKILSRITRPTRGEAVIHGRVGSLLEVGTGFHPELTGRENIRLNGALLGMKKAEIDRHFDAIVAFAEVERFIDTPVKRYSSGMYMRLAFAVAAHLQCEILLVDEVLAVGDLAFQRRCLRRMRDVAEEGRTVLFVSHNMAAIKKLCHRVVYLESGKVISSGDPAETTLQYAEGASSGRSVYDLPPLRDSDAPGWADRLAVENGEGHAAVVVPVGQPWQIRIHFIITRRTEHFMIALGLRTSEEIVLRTSWSTPCTLEPGAYQAIFRETNLVLSSDRYSLMVGLSSFERTFQYVESAGFLDIADVTEQAEFVRVSKVGAILNPFDIEITAAAG